MRIAYVISTLERCGPVNVLYGIVDKLKDECDIAVFTLAEEGPASRVSEFNNIGVKVECVVSNRVASAVYGASKLRTALSVFQPDIVHVHGFRACLLCSKLSYKRVVTIHNCLFEDYKTTYGKIRALWLSKVEAARLNSFDMIIACSESNASFLQRKYGLHVQAVRNGVDQTIFHKLSGEKKKAERKKVGYPEDKIVFISTGGCSERKRTLSLIRGFHSANDESGTCELHVFGLGPDYKKCAELNYHDVVLHGFESDVVPYLQSADVFISASSSEGMPMAVLEALSCGLPALLSNIPSHQEVLQTCHEQECVALLSSADDEGVRRGIKQIVKDDQLQISPPTDVSMFSSAAMANEYKRYYQSVVGAGMR